MKMSAEIEETNEISPSDFIDPVIETKDLSLFYGDTQALFDVSMAIPRRRVVGLIGPSGCGKSTFLRCINRMTDLIDGVRIEGSILLDGEEINRSDIDVISLRRRVGISAANADSSTITAGVSMEPASAAGSWSGDSPKSD